MTDQDSLKAAVATAIKDEFVSRQDALLQAVRSKVAEALKDDQRVVVVSDQKKEERPKSHEWDVAQLILTAIIGFVVWYAQSRLSDKITAANQMASTRYVLTQEYYKERFKVYQQTYEKLATLQGAFEIAQQDATGRNGAIDAKNSFGEQLARQELYFNPDILKDLEGISFLAAQMPTVNPSGTTRLYDLKNKIIETKKRMYAEVSGEIGSLPPPQPQHK